jgi:hypothetical protein
VVEILSALLFPLRSFFAVLGHIHGNTFSTFQPSLQLSCPTDFIGGWLFSCSAGDTTSGAA